MGLFYDIFYDLGPEILEIFVSEPRIFYIHENSYRPLARPDSVSEFDAPRCIPIKCTPPFKNKNELEKGGVSRSDLTGTRNEYFQVFVFSKDIPSDVDFTTHQTNRIEIDYQGRRLILRDYQTIEDDPSKVIGMMLFFGA